MLILYNKEQSNESGIYKISSLIDDRFYIGSAVRFRKRKDKHIFELLNKCHHSNHLQNFVNKYGIDKLKFEIIEECSKETLIQREQYYIDNLNPQFNECKIAGNQLGIKRTKEFCKKISLRNKNKSLSEECKLKKSIAMKEYWKNNPEKYEKLRSINKQKGKHKHTIVSINKMKENNTRRLSESIIRNIQKMYEEGFPKIEIIRKLSVSKPSVDKYCKPIDKN